MNRKKMFASFSLSGFFAISLTSVVFSQNINSIQEQSAATECVPACRSGYTCIDGECKELCNPPCPPDQQCDKYGICVSKPSNFYNGSDKLADNAKPVRSKYKNSVSLELPWNGLVGFGVVYTNRPNQNLAFDGGIGLSSMGIKYGIRGRYVFSSGNASPFAGLGYMIGGGSNGVKTTISTAQYTNLPITFDLKPINFLQFSGGLDFLAGNGFSLLLGAGWAIPLNNGVQNISYNGLTESQFRASIYYDPDAIKLFNDVCNLLYKGGFVLSLGLGFSF